MVHSEAGDRGRTHSASPAGCGEVVVQRDLVVEETSVSMMLSPLKLFLDQLNLLGGIFTTALVLSAALLV